MNLTYENATFDLGNPAVIDHFITVYVLGFLLVGK